MLGHTVQMLISAAGYFVREKKISGLGVKFIFIQGCE